MTSTTRRLFQRYETLPFLCMGDQKVPIPYETGGSDTFGYRPYADAAGFAPELLSPEYQQRLVEGGVDIEDDLGVEVEDYYNSLLEYLPDFFEEYTEDREEFMENYSYFQDSENWEALFVLYQQLLQEGEELSLYLDKQIVGECFYIHLIIGQRA